MERYKRLVQFFSNPEKTLKDLYPFQIHSNTENSVESIEHDSICPSQNDERSGSEYSVSRESSQSHYSKTFGLDDPPSRLELKRRPRKGIPQNASQMQGHTACSSANAKNHLSINSVETDRQALLQSIDESDITSLPTHHSPNNGNNYSPKGSPERARKRRRSPDATTGNKERHSRDISTTNRRKAIISKCAEEIKMVNFSSESFEEQRSPLRLLKTAPSSSGNKGSRQSSRSSSKQLSNAASGSSPVGRVSLQSTNQLARSSGKVLDEPSRVVTNTKKESRSQRDFSPTKCVTTTKQVTIKNRQDMHYKEIYDASQTRQLSAPYVLSNDRTSQAPPTTSKSPTKTKLYTMSTPDTIHKNTKTSQHPIEELKLTTNNGDKEKSKTQQNIKSRKLKKDSTNSKLAAADDETIVVSSKSEKPESIKSKYTKACDNRIIHTSDQTCDITSPQSTSTENKPTVENALLSPRYLNKCLTIEGKSLITTLSNKDVSRSEENSGETQKLSLKSTASWRSNASESTDGESLLDLEKFKQAIMSVEIPTEYLEPEETETSENILNILETISESPLEECITTQHPLESEVEVVLNETTCNNNTVENLSQRTLNGCEDLSDIQCTYVYGREPNEDQFQLQWIKLLKTGETVSEIPTDLNADHISRAMSRHDKNVHVCSLNVPANSKNQPHGDTEISQHATYITLPTKSPQSEDNSVVDIIVLREENLTEEQRAAIERYKSGMKKKRYRKTTSNTSANAANQRVGDPIVIPISGPESNPKSTTGFAVLTDWPEVPLSVDVDVKSWLSKSDTDETDSVIYVNQPHSIRSQNTSLWASQTVLDNVSEYNVSEHGNDGRDESLNGDQCVQSLSEETYKWSFGTIDPAHFADSNVSPVHEKPKVKPASLRRSTQRSIKELENIERPRTAPPGGQRISSARERLSHGHGRSKSSNQSGIPTAMRYKTHKDKKTADELDEIICHLKNYENLIRANTESSQRSMHHTSHHKKLQNTEILKTRNSSPSDKSCSPAGDDIQILFTCSQKTKEKLSPNDKRQYANNDQDEITDRNTVLAKPRHHRKNSERSNILSNISLSTTASDKTSCSIKSGNDRPRSESLSCARRDEDSNGSNDKSREKETTSKKRNRMHGKSHLKTHPKGDKYFSRYSLRKDNEKTHKSSDMQESQSSDQRRKLSPDITKTSKNDNATQCTRREGKEQRVAKSSISSQESNASSEKRFLRRSSEQNVAQLRAYLKVLKQFREKCGKKDRIIGVLIEQLTTLPLSDNTRRRIAAKVSARLEEGSLPHRDYSCSDILDILQMKRSPFELLEDSQSPPEDKKYSDEKTDSNCRCPKYFKIAGAVGSDSLLLTWELPSNVDDVAGYMVDVDGQLRQLVRSATRTSALLMDLDLKKCMHLALRTKLRSGEEPTCHPPLELEYTPYDEAALHWSVSDAQI